MQLNTKIRDYKGNSLLKFPEDYVIIDIETTGLSLKNNEIIEIGAVKVCNNQITSIFQSLIRPKKPINDYISNLTGITNEMVVDASSESEVLDSFISFAGGHILIGHNINFDINFLYDHCVTHLGYGLKNDFIDIMELMRKKQVLVKNNKLMMLCVKFVIQNSNTHRALSDCLGMNDFFQYLKLQQKPIECIGELDFLNLFPELNVNYPLDQKKCLIHETSSDRMARIF